MSKFEIHLKSGKIVEVLASNKANATVVAISKGLMDKLDCYDIQDILEINPFVHIKIKSLADSAVDSLENSGKIGQHEKHKNYKSEKIPVEIRKNSG